MNRIVENGIAAEMACGPNFAYTLSNSGFFSLTEYKVLQSQQNSCFVPCMKLLYNGNVQLCYLTKSYQSFASLLPSLAAKDFFAIVSNLFKNIMDVSSNGFLSCQNVDISSEHIYVEPNTHEARLVYLPLNPKIYPDFSKFESALRIGLAEQIRQIFGPSVYLPPKVLKFVDNLPNSSISLENLFLLLKDNEAFSDRAEEPGAKAGYMRLIALNAPSKLEIEVTKDSFTLGRKKGAADGIISFNAGIGRCHCRIDRHGESFFLTDLNSTNGTYINDMRLQPDRPYPIYSGDVIWLASSDFKVVM